MAVFEEEITDVPFHGQSAFTLGVIPGEINAGELGTLPIGGDVVVFSEDVGKVAGMLFAPQLSRTGWDATCGARNQVL